MKQTIQVVEERRNAILEAVISAGNVSVDQLAAGLGVSRMTVHRDIDALAMRGLVRKERGGATAESSLLFESNFHFRRHQETGAKRTLAEAAARLVVPGQVILIDDSSTTLQMADWLRDVQSLTVISNSLPLTVALADCPNINLIGVGGRYSRTFHAFFGLGCEMAISELRADIAFLSSSAVSGLTAYHQHEEVIRAKRAMMASSEQKVLLVDHTKFGRTALHKFSELSEFDHILIDHAVEERTWKVLQSKHLPIQVVDPQI